MNKLTLYVVVNNFTHELLAAFHSEVEAKEWAMLDGGSTKTNSDIKWASIKPVNLIELKDGDES